MSYPAFTVTKADWNGRPTFEAAFEPDHELDAVTITGNIQYLLVPAEDVEHAFASLQEAGEIMGCIPGQDIVRFLHDRRKLLEEAASLITTLAAKSGSVNDMNEARLAGFDWTKHYLASTNQQGG